MPIVSHFVRILEMITPWYKQRMAEKIVTNIRMRYTCKIDAFSVSSALKKFANIQDPAGV